MMGGGGSPVVSSVICDRCAKSCRTVVASEKLLPSLSNRLHLLFCTCGVLERGDSVVPQLIIRISNCRTISVLKYIF